MPVRKDPQAASDAWVAGLSAATPAIAAGVAGVTQAPGRKAAAARQKWAQNVQASQDKWARNVGNVSLTDWQQSMTNVGIPRIAQGAAAKQQKFTNFAQQFFPFLAQGVAKVEAMPSTTLEDNINRAVAMMRHNAGFKKGPTTGGGA